MNLFKSRPRDQDQGGWGGQQNGWYGLKQTTKLSPGDQSLKNHIILLSFVESF